MRSLFGISCVFGSLVFSIHKEVMETYRLENGGLGGQTPGQASQSLNGNIGMYTWIFTCIKHAFPASRQLHKSSLGLGYQGTQPQLALACLLALAYFIKTLLHYIDPFNEFCPNLSGCHKNFWHRASKMTQWVPSPGQRTSVWSPGSSWKEGPNTQKLASDFHMYMACMNSHIYKETNKCNAISLK